VSCARARRGIGVPARGSGTSSVVTLQDWRGFDGLPVTTRTVAHPQQAPRAGPFQGKDSSLGADPPGTIAERFFAGYVP